MNKKIFVTRSSMPSYEEYCQEIQSLWDTHILTNMGIKHNTFQNMLEEYLCCPHVTLYTNGHLALESMLSIFNFPKGSEIITTPFTFASTTHAIVRCGYIPVFCDINPINFCIDADKIEALITDKTVAIMPVHVYGNVCNIEKIDSIAQKYGLKVLYDAAHAFGVKYKGVSIANYGDCSMFSFHATKVFNTIEGGAVCYHNDDMVKPLNDWKNFGIRSEDSVVCTGGNAKMNEFQAAMGICNLRHIETEITKRKKIYEKYVSMIGNVDGIRLNQSQTGVEPNYAYFPVVFDGFKYSRDEVYKRLKANNIYARKYFYPTTNNFECYQDLPTVSTNKTPIAEFIASNVLTLPIYTDLTFENVERICDIIQGN